jgi:phage baseplate assembly protein W
MALTRADTLTTTLKKQEYFSDFLNSFAFSPIGNNLGKVTNEHSIKQSLKNLIFTNLGERLFQPNIGSNVFNSLFEPNIYSDDTVANTKDSYKNYFPGSTIEFNIKNTIKFNEPRVNLLEVNVTPTDNDNSLQVNIIFCLINNPEPITLNFLLKRVR